MGLKFNTFLWSMAIGLADQNPLIINCAEQMDDIHFSV